MTVDLPGLPGVRGSVLGVVCVTMLATCMGAPSEPMGGLAIAVAPLSLPGVTRATYDLTVKNGAGELVASVALDSARYGAADGSLAYVAPCDPTAGDNHVILEVTALYEGTGGAALIDPDTWLAPGPIDRTATCLANADVPVTFDVSVMRRARQGFLDVTVEFSDVFCSAKLDCDAVHSFPGFDDAPAFVLALSCVGRDGEGLTLYLDDLELSCGPPDATALLDPTAGPGFLSPGDGLDGDTGLVTAAAVYKGVNQLQGGALYWNVAFTLADGLADCAVRTQATASVAPFVARTTPTSAVRPYIVWDVQLTDGDGAPLCSPHPVGGTGDAAGVSVAYTTDGPVGFDHDYSLGAATCDDGVQNGSETGLDCGGLCPPCPGDVTGVDAAPPAVSVEATRTTQLTATVSPADADDPTVVWSVDDPAVATVDATGRVTGVAAGAAVVTVTTVDGGFSDTVAVTVTPWVPIAYAPTSTAFFNGITMCNLDCLRADSCWAGVGRADDDQQDPNFTLDGVLSSTCAIVALAAPVDAKRVSLRFQTVQTICGDSCNTACGTYGSGNLFAEQGGAWRRIANLPRAVTAVTYVFDGAFGPIQRLLVCRDGAGHHRDNFQVRALRVYN